jgi:type IV pilus assembly protein PilW
MKEPAAMKQRGFSMVELLVALVIGLFLLAEILQAFVSSNHTYITNDSLARTQENGRFSLEFISRDIRNAGYNSRVEVCAGNVNYIPEFEDSGDLQEGYMRIALDIDEDDDEVDEYLDSFQLNSVTAVKGFDYDREDDSWAFGSGDSEDQDDLDDLLTDVDDIQSDILLVRRSDTSSDSDGFTVLDHSGGSPPGSADMKISNADGIVEEDDILVVVDEDCTRAAVFQVSNVSTNSGNGQTNLVHNTGGTQTPGNRTKALGYDFTDGKVLLGDDDGMEEVYYYVRPNDEGTESLYRRIDGTEEPLVEGVEDLQLEYKTEDSDDYLSADAISDFDEVVSVRIWVLVRGSDANVATEPFDLPSGWPDANTPDPYPDDDGDGILRQVFSTTAAIRNRLE